MCRSFVHLHNHTEYSLLDGATRVKDLVRRAKELEMPAVAISDHGVMFGAMEFYLECQKQGVKPIIGMEAYVAPNGRHKKSGKEENETRHLLLLARNVEGYRNLCKLHSVAALEGFYYRPRIDHDLLREHARGLIGSTTCIGSEVNQLILAGQLDEAKRVAAMYKEMFDEGCYFVELQDHGIPAQREMNVGLLEIAKELKLPLVATNDAHFLCQSDSEAHDVLLCIGMGKLREEKDRMRFTGNEFIKTADEMAALFPQHPEAIENSLMIAEMCQVELGIERNMMPNPSLPEGATPASYLRDVAESGLKERVTKPTDEAWERLNYELGVIESTGFDSYFLLVREFANFTRSQGIMFGVRGSAAGSLVSYCLGITDVNPVEYDLTFERFLNPERVSMPDIDMDFEDERRDEVIRWVSERYGSDRVAQIVTFGTLGAKAAIKDAGRVMGYLPQDTDRICKLLPNRPGLTLKKALDPPGDSDEDKRFYHECSDFRSLAQREPAVKTLVETARTIEGLARHAGVHAAGVVVASEPLDTLIPLYRGNDNQAITAYEMGILEKIGLLKMDFLGLSNLTVLARTIENIRRTHADVAAETLAVEHPVLVGGHQAIPHDDAKTFDMLGRGETVGVFQLESPGMKRNIMELRPRSVYELSAMVALYRPGPIDHIAEFIDKKHGRQEVTYLDERMRPILEGTYGVIVYQDQVLKIVQSLAGFSLGRADILRRAMGKKDRVVMDSMRKDFMEGCAERDVDPNVANTVWEKLQPFAGYAFNKAHAVCYGILAYQTAYLKANYPVEYMAGLLAVYRTREDKVTTYIEECRRQKIQVLRPDVSLSEVDFTIEQQGKQQVIRFGLGAIKGVGEGLVAAIIRERQNGEFTHLYEFVDRVRPAGLNRNALEALVKAGALESIDKNRAKLLAHLDAAIAYADHANRHRIVGQDSLFGGGGDAQVEELKLPELPHVVPADRTEIMRMEKETMGIYVSDHPLRGHERTLSMHTTHSCAAIGDLEDSTKVKVAGVISQISKTTSQRNGTRIIRLTLEDFTGQAPCFVLGENAVRFDPILAKDRVVVINGWAKSNEGRMGGDRGYEVQIIDCEELPAPRTEDLEDDNIAGSVMVRIVRATKPQLEKLRGFVQSVPGPFQVVIQFAQAPKEEAIILLNRIQADPQTIRKLERLFDHAEVDVVEYGASPVSIPSPNELVGVENG